MRGVILACLLAGFSLPSIAGAYPLNEYVRTAMRLLSDKDYRGAVDAANKAFKSDPNDPAAIAVLALSYLSTSPPAVLNGDDHIPDSIFPDFDRGCASGSPNASRFPTSRYDAATRQRITYNFSRCTGGYIIAMSDETAKSWNVDVDSDGDASGRDGAGNTWKYDRSTAVFTNLTTGAHCREANLTQVCD